MFLLFLLLLLLLFLLLFSFCLVNGCVMLCRASVVGAVVVVCWICHIVYTLFSLSHSLCLSCALSFRIFVFFLHFCFALFWLAARVFGATWRMRNANALRIRNPFLHKAKYLSVDIFMYIGNSWQEFWSQYAMRLLLQLPFQESCQIYLYIYRIQIEATWRWL